MAQAQVCGSSTLSEFRTSVSKVLTLWHCVKVKQHYLRTTYLFATSTKNDTSTNSHFTWNSFYCYSKNKNICWYYIIWPTLAFRLLLRAKGFAISNKVILCTILLYQNARSSPFLMFSELLDQSPDFLTSDDFVRSNEIVTTKWPIY